MKFAFIVFLLSAGLLLFPPSAKAYLTVELDGVDVGGYPIDRPYWVCENTQTQEIRPDVIITLTDSETGNAIVHDSCNGPLWQDVLVIPEN